MKFNSYIFLGIFILITFSQCKNFKKTLDETPPFEIESATYTDWVGGVRGVRGTTIKILVKNQNREIDTLYFRGNTIVPELEKLESGKLQIIGNVINKEKPVLILHSNTQQEYGNKPPVKTNKKFPFELASDEVVVSYIKNKVVKFFKIKLKKEKQNYLHN